MEHITSLLAQVFMFNVQNQSGKRDGLAEHGWEALIEPLESCKLLMSQHFQESMTSETNLNGSFCQLLMRARLSDVEHFVLQLSKNLTQVLSFIKPHG